MPKYRRNVGKFVNTATRCGGGNSKILHVNALYQEIQHLRLRILLFYASRVLGVKLWAVIESSTPNVPIDQVHPMNGNVALYFVERFSSRP